LLDSLLQERKRCLATLDPLTLVPLEANTLLKGATQEAPLRAELTQEEPHLAPLRLASPATRGASLEDTQGEHLNLARAFLLELLQEATQEPRLRVVSQEVTQVHLVVVIQELQGGLKERQEARIQGPQEADSSEDLLWTHRYNLGFERWIRIIRDRSMPMSSNRHWRTETGQCSANWLVRP